MDLQLGAVLPSHGLVVVDVSGLRGEAEVGC